MPFEHTVLDIAVDGYLAGEGPDTVRARLFALADRPKLGKGAPVVPELGAEVIVWVQVLGEWSADPVEIWTGPYLWEMRDGWLLLKTDLWISAEEARRMARAAIDHWSTSELRRRSEAVVVGRFVDIDQKCAREGEDEYDCRTLEVLETVSGAVESSNLLVKTRLMRNKVILVWWLEHSDTGLAMIERDPELGLVMHGPRGFIPRVGGRYVKGYELVTNPDPEVSICRPVFGRFEELR